MPLFDFRCTQCGEVHELLVTSVEENPSCPGCKSKKMEKLLSAHSSYQGSSNHRLPGEGDTACCGSNPGLAGCAGPGSCCGKGH